MLATLFYHPYSLQYDLPDSMILGCKASPKRLSYRIGTSHRGYQRRNISKCDDIDSYGRFFMKNHDDRIEISLDVPGIKSDDLNLNVENGMMTVSGQRTIHIGSDSPQSKRRRVFHQLKLSDTVDVENISANLSNGILTISLPKMEPPKPLQIKITERHSSIEDVKQQINQDQTHNESERSNEDDLVIVETVENKEEVTGESDDTMKS
jgi:HSP20 family protein